MFLQFLKSGWFSLFSRNYCWIPPYWRVLPSSHLPFLRKRVKKMGVQKLHGALDEMDYLDFFQSRFRPQYEMEKTALNKMKIWENIVNVKIGCPILMPFQICPSYLLFLLNSSFAMKFKSSFSILHWNRKGKLWTSMSLLHCIFSSTDWEKN